MPNSELEQTLGDETSEEALLGEGEFSIPGWLRCIAVIVLLVVLVASIGLFVMYLYGRTIGLEPSKLGVPNLIIFSILGIIVFLIPWEDYGLRIKKFGPFEFEKILSTQAKEHAGELVELRERIQQLENQWQTSESKNDDTATAKSAKAKSVALDQSRELRERLLEFLTEFQRYAFSPSRIFSWGSKKTNYTDLKNFDVNEIRRTLQAMVADGVLETRISRKGNTLYRIPR